MVTTSASKGNTLGDFTAAGGGFGGTEFVFSIEVLVNYSFFR